MIIHCMQLYKELKISAGFKGEMIDLQWRTVFIILN